MLSFNRSRTPSEAAEVPDIDVTPVMNMFIILIPFLVSMAVFTHLSIVEFSLPPNVGAGLDDPDGKPKLKLTVVLQPDYLAITHGETMLDSLAIHEGTYDFDSLSRQLAVRREDVELKSEAIVAVADGIAFRHVVAVMDRCREAGLEKIGLANAPEE